MRIAWHTVDLPTEGVAQRGYRRDYLGTGVKWLGVLWLLWLQLSLLLLVIGQYNGAWPFYSVDLEPTWNSYTRGFLAAWVTSTTALMLLKRFEYFFSTLYLLPCELILADYVMMTATTVDECGGGVIRHSDLCKVEIRFNDESSDIHEWQKRSDNFEASLTWVWMSWATIDVAVCYSYGHVYRRAVYRNLALMVTVIALGVPVLVLLLNGSCSYNCAFKINCKDEDYFALKDSWFNYFLFSYEEIGGTEWYSSVPSNVLPVGLRWGFLALFSGMTLLHHLSYSIIILGPWVQKVLPSWGWGAEEASAGMVNGGGRSFQLPKLRVLGKKIKRRLRRGRSAMTSGKSKVERRNSLASLATDADFTGMDYAEDRFADIQHVAFEDETVTPPSSSGAAAAGPVLFGRQNEPERI
ncbi:hypothetical protein Pmar_PMAR019632 [Perkinsus marinus ATCC 50983]|uniref:Uncharacterized protein n=1 Tax=Perkinsus marinus (strain ATCC 50983 / TXsc) TaxID=423536 RepID=C5LF83_PERM5|nr:hypothetical protein Pmar_PMAR019632 [Perkinsus marinus ATCC 50983]EER04598.1 hypothetical protein Pmar_PMAR019632 [Perkinsus marinus ATCC 50983]|eukprot:XP_002772782.1 hypothetical protein Pmar_PMAR019632 [Perkinsus marinus ATCC 50983]